MPVLQEKSPKEIGRALLKALRDTNLDAARYFLTAQDVDVRAVLDAGPDTLARKIVSAHQAAIPVIAIVGAREARDGTVTLRRRDGSQRLRSLAAAIGQLRAEEA